MLSTPAFADWSKKVVLVLHNTSRVQDEPYPNLLFQMGGAGFPTVSYLDGDGRLLQQVGNVVTLKECEDAFVALQQWQQLRAAVEKGDAGADKEKELFLLELRMGNRPFAEMQQRRDALKLGDDERKACEQPLVNLEFTEIVRATPRDQMATGGEKFVAMWRAGRVPQGGSDTLFWQYAFAFAKERADVPLFKELLDWLRQNRGSDSRLQRYVKMLEQQLEQIDKK